MKAKEILLVFCVIAPMAILNICLWFWGRDTAPPGHSFIPYHNSTTDYPTYISFIRQGIDGKIGVVNLFAIEEHSPVFLYSFYQLLGWLGRLLGIADAHVVYHVSRFVLGFCFAVSVYGLMCFFFPHTWQRIVGLTFVLYSGSIPFYDRFMRAEGIRTYMTWWSYLDPVARFSFLPHYLAGHICLVISFWSYLHAEKHIRYFVIASFFGWIAGFIHPPSLIVLLLATPVYALYCRKLKTISTTIAFCAVSMTSLLLLNRQSAAFPWSIGRGYESLSFAVNVWEYFLALGVVLWFALLGIVQKKAQKYTWLLIAWIGFSLAGSYDLINRPPLSEVPLLKSLFPISNIRFLQMAVWIPAAILAVRFMNIFIKKPIQIGYLFCTWLVLTVSIYPYTIKSIVQRQYPAHGIFAAPPDEWFVAQKIINQAPAEKKAVFAMPHAGAFIPGYSGWKSYVGANDVVTPDFAAKAAKAFAFYKGTLSQCESYDLLLKNTIGVVFSGFDEQGIGNAVETLPFLRLWRTVGTTKLYLFTRDKPFMCTKL